MGLLKVLFWATVGGAAAQRFHVPGGAFIGALLACVLYRVFSAQAEPLPASVSLTVQILAGVLVGSSFDPQLVKTFKHLLPWAFLGAILYLAFGFLLAHMLSLVGVLEPKAALYSLTPGGLLGMSVISTAEGTQPGVVVMFHMVRVILVLLAAPFVAHFAFK
jgi:membrane AbrB-like protein